ncbi:MAG: hypothetical protein MI867_30390, partial [Pseudomonadales bacterium]|nr:hypothetical protein [Pseudomonadales bacterium]
LTTEESQQVLAAFDEYFDYLDSINEAQQHIDPTLSLNEKHEWIKAQRQAILGDELAKRYFEYDEIYDDYSLAKLGIMNNPNLSPNEKLQAIDYLSNQLPEELVARESKDNEVKMALIHDQQQRQNLSLSELYQSRLNQHGYEATQRLTELDNHRLIWQERYDQYTQEAQAIRESNLAAEDKQLAIDQLREKHFNEPEQIRVATLDEMTGY